MKRVILVIGLLSALMVGCEKEEPIIERGGVTVTVEENELPSSTKSAVLSDSSEIKVTMSKDNDSVVVYNNGVEYKNKKITPAEPDTIWARR